MLYAMKEKQTVINTQTWVDSSIIFFQYFFGLLNLVWMAYEFSHRFSFYSETNSRVYLYLIKYLSAVWSKEGSNFWQMSLLVGFCFLKRKKKEKLAQTKKQKTNKEIRKPRNIELVYANLLVPKLLCSRNLIFYIYVNLDAISSQF